VDGGGFALCQPEETVAVCAEALEVGIAHGSGLAIMVVAGGDAERRQNGIAEPDRPGQIAGGEDDVAGHRGRFGGVT